MTRLPPSQNRFNNRKESDYALASRMLLKLKKGEDVRPEKIAEARVELQNSASSFAERLDRAMDILMDEMEVELTAAELAMLRETPVKETPRDQGSQNRPSLTFVQRIYPRRQAPTVGNDFKGSDWTESQN